MSVSNKEKIEIRFNELWHDYEPYVRKLCTYKLSSMPYNIDDCVQDVFIALLDAMNKGIIIEHPKTWLSTVASNKIKDCYNRANREASNTVSMSDELIQSIADEKTAIFVDETLSDEQVLRNKQKVLNQLSDEEQALLSERYDLKYDIKRIAKLHGVTQSNVYQRLCRLRKKVIGLINKNVN